MGRPSIMRGEDQMKKPRESFRYQETFKVNWNFYQAYDVYFFLYTTNMGGIFNKKSGSFD